MAKDKRKKTKGSWCYGWVRYTFTDLNGDTLEGRRTTSYDLATAGQAQRAADSLAGALTAPMPIGKWERHASKNDAWHTMLLK